MQDSINSTACQAMAPAKRYSSSSHSHARPKRRLLRDDNTACYCLSPASRAPHRCSVCYFCSLLIHGAEEALSRLCHVVPNLLGIDLRHRPPTTHSRTQDNSCYTSCTA